MRTYDTYLCNELNVIGNTSAKDYWEERCPIRASGCILRAAWCILRAAWEVLGHLGRFLGGSWSLLGRSWGDLGASGGDLGTSGGGLGASGSGLLGACWHKIIFDRFLDRFWTDLEAQRGPQRSSKRTPK